MTTRKQSSRKAGLQFRRRFTKDDVNVFDQFEYDYRTSVIRNPSGEVVFEMNNVGVPNTAARSPPIYLPKNIFAKPVYHNPMEVLEEKPVLNR